jgi:hypothetical protein
MNSTTSVFLHIQVGKRLERTEGLDRLHIITSALQVTGNPVGIRPVRLDRNCGEALLFNQPFCDLRSHVVKIVRPLRGFP